MQTYTVTEAREKLSEALGSVRYGGETVQLTHHGHPIAVLVGADEWERMSGNDLLPKQLPPDNPRHRCNDNDCKEDNCDWTTWLFAAGRGAGKTYMASRWVVDMAMTDPGCKVAVIGLGSHIRNICFERVSGIVRVLDDKLPRYNYNKNDLKITLPNDSVIQGIQYERVLREQELTDFAYAWYSEVPAAYWFTRPLQKRGNGGKPRMLITITGGGARTKAYIDKMDNIHVTRMSTLEAPWISKGAIRQMMENMSPEEIRTELHGEIDDGT